MTDLEKRLISSMSLGIWISCEDGHRWIHSEEIDYYDFNMELKKHGISLNNKIYGGYVGALDWIDEALKMMGQKTLLERFWMDEEWDIMHGKGTDNRIDKVKKEKGGLY